MWEASRGGELPHQSSSPLLSLLRKVEKLGATEIESLKLMPMNGVTTTGNGEVRVSKQYPSPPPLVAKEIRPGANSGNPYSLL